MNQKLHNEQEQPPNCRYLLDVEDNHIAVNDHTSLERDNPVRSELTFQFLNPDRANEIIFHNPNQLTSEAILLKLQNREAVTDTSYIRFYFPCGTDVGDFIDSARGKLITFETESGDWSVAEGFVDDRHISFVISCYNQKIIKTLFSVYFKCQNIQSYAPVGLTYVYADIKNVVGIDDVITMFPISKRPAVPQINRFFSNKTTVTGSGKLSLDWQISGAKEGLLTPGEIDIFKLPARRVEVVPNRSMAYRILLKADEAESEAVVNVYEQPPEILQMDYVHATTQLTWRTQYGDEQHLAIGVPADWLKIDESGTKNIPIPTKPQVALRAKSLLSQSGTIRTYSALHLQGISLDKPQLFRCSYRLYMNYSYYKWIWTTQDTKDVTLQISNDGKVWNNASTVNSGEFEYVSDTILYGARLVCTHSDGSAYPVLVLEVVT